MVRKMKKITLLSMCLVFGIFTSASAATMDTWGPNWYTPYKGETQAHWNYMYVGKIAWTQSAITEYDWKDAWEWEFRPQAGNPDMFWNGPLSFVSNLPDAYYEYENGVGPDANDLAIATHSPQNATANTEYYGYLYLDPKCQCNQNVVLESEYGWDLGGYGDAVPQRYEVWQSVPIGNNVYSW